MGAFSMRMQIYTRSILIFVYFGISHNKDEKIPRYEMNSNFFVFIKIGLLYKYKQPVVS